MYSKDVQKFDSDYTIWKDTVWINHENKKFLVPIWRNGSTTFTHNISEKNNYVLEKLKDNSYEGYAFIRDPVLRIKGQLSVTSRLQNMTINKVLESIRNPITSVVNLELYKHNLDPHLRTQYSFLENYNIKYYINLDNPKYTGDNHIDSIIDLMMIKELKLNPNPGMDLKFDFQEEDWKLIEETFKEDYILFKEKVE
tara:strand:- start:7258 stop:7848 length:591 start_codon:yes stop_codon:yes gene_type:complete